MRRDNGESRVIRNIVFGEFRSIPQASIHLPSHGNPGTVHADPDSRQSIFTHSSVEARVRLKNPGSPSSQASHVFMSWKTQSCREGA